MQEYRRLSFTAVVGPNGSGKSNIIDALLFVLGYRARKLRQSKLADLIHVSEHHPDIESCTVAIHFSEIIDSNASEYKKISNSELVVSRSAYKNGKSSYYINGAETTFTQVTDLLRRKGIDLDHKRFLILQGEVESIALMKPKGANEHEEGLLEYLEDIIGTSRLVSEIKTAEENFEKMTTEYSEQLTRYSLKENELVALKDHKMEAERFLQQEKVLTEKKNLFFQYGIKNFKASIASMENSIATFEEKLDALKRNPVLDQVSSLEAQLDSSLSEFDDLKQKISEASKEMGKFEREEISLEEKKKYLTKKIKNLQKLNDENQLKIKSAVRNNELSKNEFTAKQQELHKLQEALLLAEEEYSKIMDSLRGKTEKFQVEIEKKQKLFAPINEKILSVKAEIENLQAQAAFYQQQIQKALQDQSEGKSSLENLKTSFSNEKNTLDSLTADRKQLQKVLLNKESLHTSSQQEYQKMKEELDRNISLLEEQRQSEEKSKEGDMIKLLMEEEKTGRIKGIHGRLGSLGVINEKYDVAISTACGGLDHVVVDTTSTAQKCIEFLRRKKLGRTTFIILDKLGPSTEKSAIPKGSTRLIDLITFQDDKFRAAFYYALKDTLIADNLAEANQLAFNGGRFRVVTLDGKLIDRSGTMSGGGSRPVKGGMRVNYSSEADKAAKIAKKLNDSISEKSLEITQLQSEIAEIKKHLTQLDLLIKKSEMNLESLSHSLENFTDQVGLSSLKEDEKQAKEFEGKLLQKQQELQKLQNNPIEKEMAALQESILQIGGIKLKTQKAKVDGLKDQIQICLQRLGKLEVENAQSSPSDESKIQEEVKELEESVAQLAALENELSIKSKVAKKMQSKCEESKIILEERKDAIAKIRKKIEEKKKECNKLKAQQIEQSSKLQEQIALVSETKHKFNCFSMNLQELRQKEPTLPTFSEQELESLDDDLTSMQSEIQQISANLENSKVNLSVIDEYVRKENALQVEAGRLEVLLQEKELSKDKVEILKKQRLDEFMAGFSAISSKLKEMYQLITLGGNAELELVDSLDPFAEGILFSVMPPKKSWKNIANLSGGEKTLSSLALVFALHDFKPTPIYVMDEIDAALDFRNVSIVANYVKEKTKNAQFIIISLRNNMFELANTLVGVYKTNNCTKSVSLDPHLFEKCLVSGATGQ